MYHSFLIHSSADGHLGCYHDLAIINSAVMNIGVHVTIFFKSLKTIPALDGVDGKILDKNMGQLHILLHMGQKHYPKAILTLKKDQALDSVAGIGGMTDQGRLPGGGECCQEISKRQD